jgi:hypothetical protein
MMVLFVNAHRNMITAACHRSPLSGDFKKKGLNLSLHDIK